MLGLFNDDCHYLSNIVMCRESHSGQIYEYVPVGFVA
jgi:hypothetical protein